jgi:hypothetical protein
MQGKPESTRVELAVMHCQQGQRRDKQVATLCNE